MKQYTKRTPEMIKAVKAAKKALLIMFKVHYVRGYSAGVGACGAKRGLGGLGARGISCKKCIAILNEEKKLIKQLEMFSKFRGDIVLKTRTPKVIK